MDAIWGSLSPELQAKIKAVNSNLGEHEKKKLFDHSRYPNLTPDEKHALEEFEKTTMQTVSDHQEELGIADEWLYIRDNGPKKISKYITDK